MRRALVLGALAAMTSVAPAGGAAAFEISPRDEYVAACTFLGGFGGAALGAAMGGLSRPQDSSRVTPFLRYGSAGALFGAVLGHELGAQAMEATQAAGDAPAPAMRETTACLGALIGELAGFGIGALVSRPAGRVNRDTREIWAGISLGAVVGAAGGYLMKPVRLLHPPATRSSRAREERREQGRIEPLLPLSDSQRELLQNEYDSRLPPQRVGPGLTPAGVERLESSLLQPESERLTGTIPRLRNEPAPLMLPDRSPPAPLAALARSTLLVGMLEGAALGAAAAGALNSQGRGFLSRVAGGGAIGTLGGMSAAAAISGSWLDPKRVGQTGVAEGLEDGRRTNGIMAGGLLGTLVGGAIGAAIHNSRDGFDRGDISMCALAGNAAGLLAGYLLSSPSPAE